MNGLLVGGGGEEKHLEKYEFVNGKDDNPYMKLKNNKCLKPPTRMYWNYRTYPQTIHILTIS
jgi:hypothetical protein